MRALRAIVAAAALALSPPLAAALPVLEGGPAPEAAAASPAIADTAEAGADARIARRISGIFGELPAFAQVEVTVSEGVVTLTGKVPAEDDIARAEGIAGRVSGVVTVENRLERDISIGRSGAVGSLAERVAGLTRMLPLLALALAIWLAIALLGYLIAGLGALWRRMARNPFLAELIASAIRFVFVVGGLAVALDIVGAKALLGAVLGGAGLVGIALGFAMRDTIENYVASLMLSLRQPFRANDHVVIDDKEGRVIRLTSRATILMTLDGNHLRLPNSTVFKAAILNYTRNPQRRFDFVLQIDTKADPERARRIGLDALEALEFVLPQPPPAALIKDVFHPNVALQFLGWIDQSASDFGKARSRALAAVKRALDSHGLALPDPVTRVQMLEDDVAKPPRRGAKGAPASSDADVEPEAAVSRMVEEERALSPGNKDLLDSSKPVE